MCPLHPANLAVQFPWQPSGVRRNEAPGKGGRPIMETSAISCPPTAQGAPGSGPRLGHGHDFQHMTIGVVEVEAAPAPAGIELAVGAAVEPPAVGEPPGP